MEIPTVNINVVQCFQNRLHELIIQSSQKVVGQFDPLYGVQVVKRPSLDDLNPAKNGDAVQKVQL